MIVGSQKHDRMHGFSLIELMCAIGIIGMLASMAMSAMNTYKSKAMAAEAITNLHVMHSLVGAYATDSAPPDCCDMTYINGSYGCSSGNTLLCGTYEAYLTLDSYGNPSACNTQNVLGFQLVDCANSRYVYGYVSANGGFGQTEFSYGLKIPGGLQAVERYTLWDSSGTATKVQRRLVYPGCTAKSTLAPSTLSFDIWTMPEAIGGTFKKPGGGYWSENDIGTIIHSVNPAADGCD